MSDRRAIREALWVTSMAAIGLLVLLLLHKSGDVMALHLENGHATIPLGFWFVAALSLALCALVPWLIRDSQPRGFRVLAVLLTAATPAAAIVFIVLNLLAVVGG